MEPTAPPPTEPQPPPRAFTQGVGTVYQLVGVVLFLLMMSICCGSGLMSMQTARRLDLAAIGWHLPLPGRPLYSAQKAISVALTVAVVLGVTVASIGLGLQAQRRRSPTAAVLVGGFGTAFWLFHAALFAVVMHAIALTTAATILALIFVALLALAIGSWREMRKNPPPADLTDLPAGYKIPYSHLHADPPEVRFAKEMEERRRRLEIQKKELEMLEKRIRDNKYKRGEL